MKKMVVTTVVTVLILLVTACGSSDSDNVKTDGIFADIDIYAPGDGKTYVEVVLKVGSGGVFATELELEGGDQLTAKTDVVGSETPKVLQESQDGLGGFTYKTDYTFDDEDITYTVAFSRAADNDAPNSFVTMPEALEYTLPAEASTFQVTDTINVTWQPSGFSSDVYIDFDVECPKSGGGTVVFVFTPVKIPDSGAYSKSAGSLIYDTSGLDLSGQCAIEITLYRSNKGTIDSNYGEGGNIVARQVRTRNIVVEL